jgi:ATP synthase protein I
MDDTDPEREKLDSMAARIQQASKIKAEETDFNQAAPMKMSQIGFTFIATILVCVFLGWLMDRELGTGPWGIVSMTCLGFAAGLWNVIRSQNRSG